MSSGKDEKGWSETQAEESVAWMQSTSSFARVVNCKPTEQWALVVVLKLRNIELCLLPAATTATAATAHNVVFLHRFVNFSSFSLRTFWWQCREFCVTLTEPRSAKTIIIWNVIFHCLCGLHFGVAIVEFESHAFSHNKNTNAINQIHFCVCVCYSYSFIEWFTSIPPPDSVIW